jgi:hypothetical protein
VTALINWAVMRIVCAERRTLPSRTAPTFSLRAIVPMSVLVALNENADVRAATCSPSMNTALPDWVKAPSRDALNGVQTPNRA